MSRWLRGPALKLGVSLILVVFLVRRYGGDERFLTTLRGLDAWAFVQAELLLAVGLVLSALRWKILLRAAGVTLSTGRAVRLYFVAFFFNFFLPTTVGGDVIRAMGVGGGTPLPVVVGSILVERLIGFGCLLLIGGTASVLVPSLETARGVLLVAAAVYGVGLGVLLFVPLPEAKGEGLPARVLRGLRDTAHQVRGYGFHPVALGLGVLLSLSWQAVLVGANAVLSAGLGGVATFGSLLALVPVVQAITMIPISFGGLGVRELGYEFFFRTSGFDPADAVALGACMLGVTVALALKGGIVYLIAPVRDGRSPASGSAS